MLNTRASPEEARSWILAPPVAGGEVLNEVEGALHQLVGAIKLQRPSFLMCTFALGGVTRRLVSNFTCSRILALRRASLVRTSLNCAFALALALRACAPADIGQTSDTHIHMHVCPLKCPKEVTSWTCGQSQHTRKTTASNDKHINRTF